MNNIYIKLGIGFAAIIVGIFVLMAMFDLKPIHGNEIGVKEDWWSGVKADPLPPATYFVLPWERVQEYSTAVNVFVMNEKNENGSYLIQSSDNQDMKLSFQVQWKLDPTKVVDIHKTVGAKNIEDKILKPTLLRVVKDNATVKEALEAYSGIGLVQLQQDIEKSLNDPKGELRQRGIIVDAFVMQHIGLDPEYTTEIMGRQIAIQKELRSVQEEKAANAEALKVKAVAQADLNKMVVEAERDKQVKVLEAEALNETAILAAEAEKQKTVLAAEAKKESGELEAAAIIAVGQATAEAEKLKLLAYSSEGADLYAKIQIAESMKGAFSNIKGYLPENMHIYTLGENFLSAVENVVNPKTK